MDHQEEDHTSSSIPYESMEYARLHSLIDKLFGFIAEGNHAAVHATDSRISSIISLLRCEANMEGKPQY